jgi:hypothetical protein
MRALRRAARRWQPGGDGGRGEDAPRHRHDRPGRLRGVGGGCARAATSALKRIEANRGKRCPTCGAAGEFRATPGRRERGHPPADLPVEVRDPTTKILEETATEDAPQGRLREDVSSLQPWRRLSSGLSDPDEAA